MSPLLCRLHCLMPHQHLSPSSLSTAGLVQHTLLCQKLLLLYTLQGRHICSLTLPRTKHNEPRPMGQWPQGTRQRPLFIFNT